MKKILISLLTLFVIISYAKQLEYPVRFAVIGDRTGDAQSGIYEEIVAEIERLKPDFVITVGDMIQGYAQDTTELTLMWTEYKTIIAPLTMPIYFTSGNHDITTDDAAPWYKNHIAKPYYSFDYKGLHFVILDASRWDVSKDIPHEQITWLIDDLKKNQKAPYTFVFYHKPFWADEIAAGKPDTLHTIFKNYGVDAVFNGHTHEYFSGKIDGILYTDVSTSGGAGDVGPTGLLYHFTWVTVDKNGISIAPIKINSVLPWDEVTISDVANINKIYNSGITFENTIYVNDDFSVLDTIFTVKLINPNTDVALEDTLYWITNEAWSIKPQSVLVKVAPNDSAFCKFIVKNKEQLYPVPALSIRFPYAKGKTYEVKKSLPVARQTYCYQSTLPPVIDGKITESFWQKPVYKLFSFDGGSVNIDSTYFYFAHDDKNLYIAAFCQDPKVDSIITKAVKQDDAVYSEDCVGYFFIPNRDSSAIYQIYFNPNGVSFDQKITDNGNNADRSWNGAYEVKTLKGKNFWSIEARIPLEQLGTKIAQGQQWGVNFRRKQPRYKSTADWQVPIQYDPKSYGLLIIK
jgi:3',5'-cyclic AMP phosphodiesterase CpdA